MFSLELEISGVAVQSIHQNSENGDFPEEFLSENDFEWLKQSQSHFHCDFPEEFLSENDFETVLAILVFYDHGVKASEAVQKITADQKEYRKCSLCVVNC